MTFGVVLITLGLLWSLHLAGVMTLSPGQLLASALLVIGLGTLVGTVAGRSPSLIVVGILLVPLVLLATVARPFGADVWLTQAETPVGDQRIAPATWEELQDSYQLGAGSLTLDLGELEPDGLDRRVSAQVGAGELIVLVPEELGLAIAARNGLGDVRLPGQSPSAAFGQQRSSVIEGADGAGSLDLDLSVGVGMLQVTVADPVAPIVPDVDEPGPEVSEPPADEWGPEDAAPPSPDPDPAG